jgi:hypothetical protein
MTFFAQALHHKRPYDAVTVAPASKRRVVCDGWLGMFDRVSSLLERDHAAKMHSLTIRTRMEVANDVGWEAQECQGDLRLRNMQYLLERGLRIERSAEQVMFHGYFIEACLPLIYGEEWNNHSMRVLHEWSLNAVKSEVMVITMRRFGKTWCVAMFVLAMMLCVPGIKIAIFSTGSRASGSLYDIIMTMLTEVPGAFQRIVRNTKEQLFIAATELPKGCSPTSAAAVRMRADKHTSQLNAYPDTVKGY